MAVRRGAGTASTLLCVLPLMVVTAPGAATVTAAAPCSSGHVSLTFDDGPSSGQTPRLVRILQRADVPATFFMVGQRVASAPQTARRVSNAGFLVANHSYAHADMRGQSSAAIRQTLRATQAAIRRAGVRPTGLMRPPYGAVDARVLSAIRSTGLRPVLWDVDPRDWEGVSSATITARVLAQLRPHRSNVVLQHDGIGNSPASVSAVPAIIAGARRRGYCFVALDEQGRPGFPTPRARLRVGDVREGGTATATVSLDRPAGRDTWVRLTTRGASARADADFRAWTGRLVVPAGARQARVAVPVRRDGTDEPTERFQVVLDRPFGVVIAVGSASVRIEDRDPPPVVRGLAARVAEPAGQPVTVPVRFELDRVSGRRVQLVVRTAPGTAGPADYVPVDREVTIPAGSRAVVVPVTIRPDQVAEPAETFTLRVASATNARVGTAATTLTIDPPAPTP